MHVLSLWNTFLIALWLAILLMLAGRFSLAKTASRRRSLSFAAGGSIAYIFVKLLPEIENAAVIFRQATHTFMPFEGVYGVNIAMLAGFLSFYALAEMAPEENKFGQKNSQNLVFWAHLTGYGGYIALIGYLLVRSLNPAESLCFYTLSMSFHFLLVGFGLRSLYQQSYDCLGRYVLAAFCLIGWSIGVMIDLPKTIVILLFGFVSGGVVSVTGIVELPKGREGKFIPFMTGAVSYAALLIISR